MSVVRPCFRHYRSSSSMIGEKIVKLHCYGISALRGRNLLGREISIGTRSSTSHISANNVRRSRPSLLLARSRSSSDIRALSRSGLSARSLWLSPLSLRADIVACRSWSKLRLHCLISLHNHSRCGIPHAVVCMCGITQTEKGYAELRP